MKEEFIDYPANYGNRGIFMHQSEMKIEAGAPSATA